MLGVYTCISCIVYIILYTPFSDTSTSTATFSSLPWSSPHQPSSGPRNSIPAPNHSDAPGKQQLFSRFRLFLSSTLLHFNSIVMYSTIHVCIYIYTYSSCYNIYIDNYITSNEHHAVMSSNSKNILKNTPSAMPGPFHSPLHCSAPFRGPESSGSLSRTGGASMLWRIGFHPTQHQGEEKSGDHGDLKLCFFLWGIPNHSISFDHHSDCRNCAQRPKSSKTALRSAHALRSFSDPSWAVVHHGAMLEAPQRSV